MSYTRSSTPPMSVMCKRSYNSDNDESCGNSFFDRAMQKKQKSQKMQETVIPILAPHLFNIKLTERYSTEDLVFVMDLPAASEKIGYKR